MNARGLDPLGESAAGSNVRCPEVCGKSGSREADHKGRGTRRPRQVREKNEGSGAPGFPDRLRLIHLGMVGTTGPAPVLPVVEARLMVRLGSRRTRFSRPPTHFTGAVGGWIRGAGDQKA